MTAAAPGGEAGANDPGLPVDQKFGKANIAVRVATDSSGTGKD